MALVAARRSTLNQRPIGTAKHLSAALPGKERTMPTTAKKPEPADEAREAARRALQTSMDTRQ